MGSDPRELEAQFPEAGRGVRTMLAAETPRHRVTLSPFQIDSTEVTNQQFQEFAAAEPEWSPGGSNHPRAYLSHWKDGKPAADQGSHPVTYITWQAASAFCAWREGRLPTEAEWEFAAAGGKSPYPWGSEPPTPAHANYSASGVGGTRPAGSYPANAFGLFDLAGNVWEFTADPWRPGYDTPVPHDPPDFRQVRTRRTIRGGSYGAAPFQLRVTARDSHDPQNPVPHVGFRCVREPQPIR